MAAEAVEAALSAPIRISRTISKTFPQNPPKSSHVDAATMGRILTKLYKDSYESIYKILDSERVPVEKPESDGKGPLTQEQKDWFFNKVPEPPLTVSEEEKIIDEIIPLVNNEGKKAQLVTETSLRRSSREKKPVNYAIIDKDIEDEYDEAYKETDVKKRVRKRNNALNKNIKRRKVTKTQSPSTGSGSNTQLSIIHEVGTLLCYFHPQLMELNDKHPSVINIDAFKSSFGDYRSDLDGTGGMNFDELCAELFNSLEDRTDEQLFKLRQAIKSAQKLKVEPMYQHFKKGAWVNTAGRFKAVTGKEHQDNPADIVFQDTRDEWTGISLKASFKQDPITIYNGGITKTVDLFGLGTDIADSIQGIYDKFNHYWLTLAGYTVGDQSFQKKLWKQIYNNERSKEKIAMLGDVNTAFAKEIKKEGVDPYKIAAAFFRYPKNKETPINVPYAKLSALGEANIHIDNPKWVLDDIEENGGSINTKASGNTAMRITIKTKKCYHRFHFRIKTASSPPSAIKINVIYLGSSKTQTGGNSNNLSLLAPDEVDHYNILYSFLDEYSELDIVNGDILEDSLDAIHGSIDNSAVETLEELLKINFGSYTDAIHRDIRHLIRYINALIKNVSPGAAAGAGAGAGAGAAAAAASGTGGTFGGIKRGREERGSGDTRNTSRPRTDGVPAAAAFGSGGTHGGKKQRKKTTTRKRKRTHKKRIRKNKTSRKNKRRTKRKSRKTKK